MNTASLNSPASTPPGAAGQNPGPGPGRTAGPGTAPAAPAAPRTGHAHDDPRVGWTAAPEDTTPPLHARRDSILPAVAAALSVRGRTLTSTGHKGDQPPAPHPLVQDFLDTLTTDHRARHTGRCPETVLVSRYLSATEAARAAKRANRRTGGGDPKPLTHGEAKRALKNARLTARHIREHGDPYHGRYAPPCAACGALLAHFGVRAVDPEAAGAKASR
ncbi:YwqJ-related putative deaminase [Streptomyces nanshensis]|uniref:Deaminase n=1 Tax=Streptomyces nanshensis TaxID=518642 RepID=A0A1E7KQP3_9ACTN|nr:YwqJ-related putative deaminase [Streptomyces nanshensis]OEV06237.1 hypothetical protein AN218_30875 [Streptomyces nanshensis]